MTYSHEFELVIGEVIHIGGIPYAYLGEGKLGGGTDPEYARATILEQMEMLGGAPDG